MKKLLAAVFAVIIALSAASCGNQREEQTQDVTDYIPRTEPVTDTTEKTTKSVKVEVETVKKTDKPEQTDAAEKTTKAEETETATETTDATEPPTQGRTRPNTRLTVHVDKGSFSKSDLTFIYGGAEIDLGDEIEDAIAILGDEEGVNELSKSRTEYDFDELTVITRKRGDKELVEQIIINSDEISTSKNAVIGMYATQLRRIYGDPTRLTGAAYVYSSGNKSLVFYHEDNVVNEIRYKLTQ